jgi:hypothetical protein
VVQIEHFNGNLSKDFAELYSSLVYNGIIINIYYKYHKVFKKPRMVNYCQKLTEIV